MTRTDERRRLFQPKFGLPSGGWLRPLHALVYAACGFAFLADLVHSDLLAFGVFYIPLVCTAVLSRNRRTVWQLASVSVAMAVAGSFIPEINPDYFDLVVNRGLSVAAILATAALVSHAGRVRENLIEQTRRAEAAERMKTEIFTNLGYDLRQPLHAIIGLTRVMAADCRANQREPLGHVQVASRRLLATINNLVDLTKFDERVPRLEPIDLAELLERAIVEVRQHDADGEVTIAADIAPDLHPLLGDAWAIRRIVENLLDNAVKFTPLGGSVKLTAVAAANDVLISVTDTGEGIPQEVLCQIGQPFLQAETGVARRMDGTGTGLALSQRLADSIGAELTLDSTPGLGTNATLRVPRRAQGDRRSIPAADARATY